MCHYQYPAQRKLLQAIFMTGMLTVSAATLADNIQHTVQAGDNLHDLAERYMGNPHGWRQIQKLNRIANPTLIKPGTTLVIPHISSTISASFVHGDVTLLDSTGNPTKAIQHGDQLGEGDRIRTGNNSYLSLEFADGSVARILANTSIRLDRIKEGGLLPQEQRIIYLEQGAVDVSATPATKRKQPHFKVTTPQAVAAVRGTRFIVSNIDNETTSSVTEGQVAMQPGKPVRYQANTLLQAGQGLTANEAGLGKAQALLPGPDLSQLPAQLTEPELLHFTWPALTESSQYQYRIARDASMEQVIWNAASVTAETTLPSLEDGEYLLAVRAMDTHGIVGYESQHQFRIHSHPSSPWLLAPQAGQSIANNSVLRCTPVTGAQGYQIQIANDPGFEHMVVDTETLDHCQYQLVSLAAGQYYWRVATIAADTAGELKHGPYSQPSTLAISEDAHTAQVNPGHAYWHSAHDNIRYLAQISRNPQFEPVIAEQLLEKPGIDISTLPAGRYYIRLATRLENGIGPFSDARIIEVKEQDNGVDRTWFDKPKF